MPSPSGKYNTHIRFSKPWKSGGRWYCYEYVRSTAKKGTSKSSKSFKTYRYRCLIRRSRG